ncbi:MAG: hypothetical protein V4507_05950, partial [Verrucomicrobiota bacterium]
MKHVFQWAILILGILISFQNIFGASCSRCKEVEFEVFANGIPPYEDLSTSANITIGTQSASFSNGDGSPNSGVYGPKSIKIKPFSSFSISWSGSQNVPNAGSHDIYPLNNFFMQPKGYPNSKGCYRFFQGSEPVSTFFRDENGADSLIHSESSVFNIISFDNFGGDHTDFPFVGSVFGIELRPSEKGGAAGSGGASQGSVSWYST